MKAKMTSTTNGAFSHLIGKIGDVEIGRQVWFYIETRTPFHTSDIHNIKYTYDSGMSIEVTTLNSVYQFEIQI